LGAHSRAAALRLRGCHPLCRTFPGSSTSATVSYSLPDQQLRLNGPTTPRRQRLPALTPTRFGLFRFRSPLLTESLLFSLPVGTEMFHFPTFPPNALCVQAPVTGHDPSRVSPFGHPRITARLPTPRGFSQAPTSFIGFWCQGIHRVPLVTCLGLHTKIRCSRPLCSSQGTGGIRSRTRRVPPAWRSFDAGWPTEEDRLPDPSGPNSVPGRPRALLRRFHPHRGEEY
jgi:hypothetical protein